MTMYSCVRTCLLLATLTMLLAACDSDSGDDRPGDDFDRAAMLVHLGEDVIRPSYEALQERVDALDAAATRFAEEPSAAHLDDLQARLRAARLAWQDVNLFQFGPAEAVVLRSGVNTYPVDTAQVEANVASGTYTLGTVSNRAAAGFPTLGYLLHGPDDSDEEVLAAYTTASDASNRLAYLQDNVGFVDDAVDATVEAWRGDYLDMFVSEANAGTDVGSSLGMLINAFVRHYERFLRDGKVGIPAGVRSAGVPRPSSTEAYYGGYSAELALANLRAAKRLFLGDGLSGTPGAGLDDYLRALDAEALAVEIEAEFDEAIDAVEALDDPLAGQIQRDNEPVLEAFQEMQDVVVLLKADMTSILGITITYQDNDGD